MTPDELINAAIYYVVFVFSVTLHEAGHAWAALRGGDLTAYHGGQVTIDPRPHMRREPFGMVILPLISVVISGWPFGFASAPYDPRWARRYPKRAGWMSLAGPAANLVLVLFAGLCARVGMAAGVFVTPQSMSLVSGVVAAADPAAGGVAYFLSAIFSLNLILLVLNLFPVPPLDGSGVLLLFLSEENAARYQDFTAQPMLGWIGILVAWTLLDVVLRPVFLFAVNLLYPGAAYA